MEAETADNANGSVLMLGIVSLVAGAATGFVGALFRLCLERVDQFRDAFIAWATGVGAIGIVVVVAACAVAAGVAAWLVRRFSPHAAGKGRACRSDRASRICPENYSVATGAIAAC